MTPEDGPRLDRRGGLAMGRDFEAPASLRTVSELIPHVRETRMKDKRLPNKTKNLALNRNQFKRLGRITLSANNVIGEKSLSFRVEPCS